MKNPELEIFLNENFTKIYADIILETVKKSKLEELQKLYSVRKKIKLRETTTVSATSKKIRNLLKIKQSDLIISLTSAGLLSFATNTIQFLMAFLMLALTSAKHLSIKLEEREAKVLLAVYNKKTDLTFDNIHNKCIELFGEFDDLQLIRSIRVLEELKILEKIDNFEYILIEEIILDYK